MNRTDGSDPANPAVAEVSGPRAIGFPCLKDRTFVDDATQAYLVIVGLLILFFYRGPAHFTGAVHLFGGCSIPCPPLVPSRPIGIDGLARAAPDPIGSLHGIKSSALCCPAQGDLREVPVSERRS